MKGRVFSGARPTGKQHIGNYLGAIDNYVKLQGEYECIYCIVDIHALTTLSDIKDLQINIREMLLDWLAAGLDPQKSIMFVQSHVPEVMELHTLLSMVTPLGWLLRVPTFKEKAKMQPENVNYGLVGYPVLMTADIVLYKADTIPVGEDQLVHLELSREIVRRFNHLFSPVFPEPTGKLSSFPMVLGLDGVNKMSKSMDNHIELAATEKETELRISRAFTDPQRIKRSDPGRPNVCNVHSLHHFYNETQREDIGAQCQSASIGCVDCKKLLSRGVNESLAPFRERRATIAANSGYIDDVLADGADRARVIAQETMCEVKSAMNLI